MEKVTFNGELVLVIKDYDDWVSKVPMCLPTRKSVHEKFIYIDVNGNCLEMGADFAAAEVMQSYPIRVYRKVQVVDVINPKKDIRWMQ